MKSGRVGLFSSKNSKTKAGFLILFEDVLIVCKVNKEGKLEKKGVVWLKEGGGLEEGGVEGGVRLGGFWFVFEGGKKGWVKSLEELVE